MRKTTIKTAALAGLASLALLIPAGSAHAFYGHNFCVVDVWGGPNYNTGATLRPGQRCVFFPRPIFFASAQFHAVQNGNYVGNVDIMISQYPPGSSNTWLNDSGQPDPNAVTQYPAPWLNQSSNWGTLARAVNNPNDNIQGYSGFGEISGQATILNFSTATIKLANLYNSYQCSASGPFDTNCVLWF